MKEDTKGAWYPDFKSYAGINSRDTDEDARKALVEKQIRKTRQAGMSGMVSDTIQKRMDMDLFK